MMGWSDKYSTGIVSIDTQHKQLFKMVDDFRVALNDKKEEKAYSALLESLYFYTRSHFAIEERRVGEISSPLAEQNKNEHKKLITVLLEHQERFSTNGFDHAEVHSLLNTVENWLSDHIGGIDLQLLQLKQ